MRTPAANANGGRRRKLRAALLATSTHCALCGAPLNPDATYPAPDSTVIDEDIPRAKGGSALDRDNTNAMHRLCNSWKSTMTIAEAHALINAGAVIGQPVTKQQRRAMLRAHVGEWNPNADRV